MCVWVRGEIFGGLVSYICKMYLCTPGKLFRGVENEGARDVWEFQHSPSRLSSSMVECVSIPEDTMQSPSLTTMDNKGITINL